VTVIGYPGNQDSAIFCVSYSSSFSATQLVFRCGGYTTGPAAARCSPTSTPPPAWAR
jgi:hypothetical protein